MTTSTSKEITKAKEMSKSLGSVSQSQPLDLMNTDTLQNAWKLSQCLAAADMLPDRFRNKPGNVLVAIGYARALGRPEIPFIQNSYFVGGKFAMEAKSIISILNTSDAIKGRVKFKFKDTESIEDEVCTAYVNTADGDVVEEEYAFQEAKREGLVDKSNSKYKSTPKLMLKYRAATRLVNVNFPELTHGIMPKEEMEDVEEDAAETMFSETEAQEEPQEIQPPEDDNGYVELQKEAQDAQQEPEEPKQEGAKEEKAKEDTKEETKPPKENKTEPKTSLEAKIQHVKEANIKDIVTMGDDGVFVYKAGGRPVGEPPEGKQRRSSDQKTIDDIVEKKIDEEFDQKKEAPDAEEPASEPEPEPEDAKPEEPEKSDAAIKEEPVSKLQRFIRENSIEAKDLESYLLYEKGWLMGKEKLKDLDPAYIEKILGAGADKVKARINAWKEAV